MAGVDPTLIPIRLVSNPPLGVSSAALIKQPMQQYPGWVVTTSCAAIDPPGRPGPAACR